MTPEILLRYVTYLSAKRKKKQKGKLMEHTVENGDILNILQHLLHF